MHLCSPSPRTGVALVAAVLLALVPAALAQEDESFSDEDLESIDRQIEEGTDSLEEPADSAEASEAAELWDEYRKYKRRDDEERVTGERVEVGATVTVRAGERVNGDAVSIGGNVVVHGVVDGDAVAVGGDVILHEGAEILGDAVSVGGRVRELGDATVQGQKTSINIPMPMGWFDVKADGSSFDLGFSRGARFAMGIGPILIALLSVIFFQLIAGRRLEVVRKRLVIEPGGSFLVGFLGSIGLIIGVPTAMVLFAITIIGILVSIVLPFVAIGVLIMGYAAACLAVGQRLADRASGEDTGIGVGTFKHLLIGFVLLSAFGILSILLDLIGGPFSPLVKLLDVLDWFVMLFATMLGFGALLTSRFGDQLPGGAPAFASNRPWHSPSPPPGVPPVPGVPAGAVPPPPPAGGPGLAGEVVPAGPEKTGDELREAVREKPEPGPEDESPPREPDKT